MKQIPLSLIQKPRWLGIITFGFCLLLSIGPITVGYVWHMRVYHEDFRSHLGQITAAVSYTIDGDLHATIRDQSDKDSPTYLKAIRPLTHFHNLYPEIVSIYTAVEYHGKVYYILDTLNDPQLTIKKALEPTDVMEEVILAQQYNDQWFTAAKAGNVYVNPDFETDNYGTFLSGHAPFYKADGTFEGVLGIDYDMQGYQIKMNQYTKIFMIALSLATFISALLSYIITTLAKRLQSSYNDVEKLSLFDGLTHLYNRFIFMELFRKEIEKTKRSEKNLYLIFVDIDDFKIINDTYGHLIGDEAIKLIAQKLTQFIRKADVVARFGGDEFLISASDAEQHFIDQMIQRIVNGVSQSELLVEHENRKETLTIQLSIGYTKYQEDDTFETMLQRADQALYISKETGKNTATFLG